MSRGNRRRRQQGNSLTVYAGVAFSGPLPPPSVLEHYNEVLPGAAERILAMAESQAHHRRELESIVIGGNVVAQRRGQWMAFSLCLLVIGIGSSLIWFERPVAGLVAILGALVTLASVFFIAKRIDAQEREMRRKDPDAARP